MINMIYILGSNSCACYYHPGREHVLGIHREAPAFIEQGTEQEILETGIKVNIYISLDTFICTFSVFLAVVIRCFFVDKDLREI